MLFRSEVLVQLLSGGFVPVAEDFHLVLSGGQGSFQGSSCFFLLVILPAVFAVVRFIGHLEKLVEHVVESGIGSHPAFVDVEDVNLCTGIALGVPEKSGHSRGSTVDLTLFDMTTEKEVDMGGTFDWFGKESHPDWCGNPETGKYTGGFPGNTQPTGGKINEVQFKNRMILRKAMMRHGFKPLPEEWWHFTLVNEPYPDTYFTHPVK